MAKYEALINYLNHEISGAMDSDTYQDIESIVRRVPTRKRLAATEFNTLLAISRDRLLFGAVGHRPLNSTRIVDFKLSFVPKCKNPQEDAIADLLLFLRDYAGGLHIRDCDRCGKWYCQGQKDGRKYCGEGCKKALERTKKPAKARKIGREKMRKYRLRQDVTALLREAGKDGMNAEAIRARLNGSAKRKKVTTAQVQKALDALETTGTVRVKKDRFCISP